MHRKSKLFSSVFVVLIAAFLLYPACTEKSTEPEPEPPEADYYAPKLSAAPVIDGHDTDEVWQSVPWAGIAYWIEGDTVINTNDFAGRYKIGWTEEKLYFLVDIVDDNFSDCWDDMNYIGNDDCVVICLDEDHSGGEYYSSHQAFLYAIELDSSVVGSTTRGNVTYFNDHCEVAQFRQNDTNTWELALNVYTASYSETLPADLNLKADLESGKQMGLTVAYIDADFCGFNCFYGSSAPLANDNQGSITINADNFGTIILTD